MKVRLKKAVWFQGELYGVETVFEVSQGVGESWIKRSLADAIGEPDVKSDSEPKKSRKKKAEQE